MAYTNLTTQVISKTGIIPTYAAAVITDGNKFVNTGKEFIHVVNASGGSINVTVPTPAQVAGLDIEDKVVAIGAGVDTMIGPFEPGYYNQSGGDKGKTYVEFSAVTSVTIAVLRV